MALVLKRFIQFYQSEQDSRVDDWFFVSTPIPCLTILASYLSFVLYWGPKFMAKRKPYNIDKLLQAYNIFQIAACLYLIIVGWDTVINLYSWKCAEMKYDDHGLFVANMVYFYHVIKVIDLLDTVFFVLRKKQNQVTFLHVYHHSGMVVLTFFGVKFLPGGHSVFMGYINCIVHTVMYFYYFLTAYDKKFKKNLWLKRRITEMQLIQFFIIILWYGQYVFRESCKYPKYIPFIIVPQNIFMCVLFGDFYVQHYILAKKKKTQQIEEAKPGVVEEPDKAHFEKDKSLFKVENKEKMF